MRIRAVIIIGILTLCTAYSQKKTQDIFGIHYAFDFYGFRDELISPFNFTGSRPGFMFSYSGIFPKSIHYVSYNPVNDNIESDYNSRIEYKEHHFKYCYYYQFLNKNVIKLYLGAGLNNYITFRNHYIFVDAFNRELLTESFSFLHSFEIPVLFNCFISEKHNIKISTDIPVFAFIYRPDYSVSRCTSFLDDGKFLSINKYFLNNTKTEYEYRLAENLLFSVQYEFYYYSISEPVILKSVQHSFSLGLKLVL